jgi:nicotinamide phosphoribosyltransferase
MRLNPILAVDSYKYSHPFQLPEGTDYLYSFFEARGKGDEVVFFGLNGALHFLAQTLFASDVTYAAELARSHMGVFDEAGWWRVIDKHHGQLPVRIHALPEGTVVPRGIPMMTVESLDPQLPWLTNFVETFLVQQWYPCTVATLSRDIKKLVLKYLEETGDPAQIDFKLHDFGVRGCSSMESAAIGGAAHLTQFKGTDNVPALEYCRNHYQEKMAGFSIPAAEHMTITIWGRDGEKDAYANMLDAFPIGLVAVVSDSYDIDYATKVLWGNTLRARVQRRNGTVVVRPDSGDPAPTVLDCVRNLESGYGSSTNTKGFRELPPQIRVIQGDGINYDSIGDILKTLKSAGYSANNVAFGMGGALLQRVHRDQYAFAFKASYAEIAGKGRDIFKSPKGDPLKASKRGKLAVVNNGNGFECIPLENLSSSTNHLVPVFDTGKVLVSPTMGEIRERSKV